jgi:hypothetical protein
MKVINTSGTTGKFIYGSKVVVKIDTNTGMIAPATVRGKVSGMNVYLVLLDDRSFVGTSNIKVYYHSLTERMNSAAGKYGYPIRHLELEWGSFYGYDGEFLVPADDLERP